MSKTDMVLELKRKQIDMDKIREKLVILKTKSTPKEKFNLSEIEFYSKYFDIAVQEFLFQVLKIEQTDYQKLLKGTIRYISSKEYNKSKEKYLRKLKNRYKIRINWNKRTYFNREKLVKSAEKLGVNVIDFTVKILGKTEQNLRRVLKDENGQKRLFIGKYVNAKLPQCYVEENLSILLDKIKIAIYKAFSKLGIRISKEEYEDEVQECVEYVIQNGNSLNRFNQPIIDGTKCSKRQEKIIYKKIYFYILGKKQEQREKLETGYIENYSAHNKIEDEEEVASLIGDWGIGEKYEKVIYKINAGYTWEELIKNKEITRIECEKLKQEIKNKILWE